MIEITVKESRRKEIISGAGVVFKRPSVGIAHTPLCHRLGARPADLSIGFRTAGLRDIALAPHPPLHDPQIYYKLSMVERLAREREGMCERRLSETAATKAIDNAAVERAGGGFAAFEQNRPPAPRTYPLPSSQKKHQKGQGKSLGWWGVLTPKKQWSVFSE